VLTNVLNEAGGYPTRTSCGGRFETCSKISVKPRRPSKMSGAAQVPPRTAATAAASSDAQGTFYDKDGHYLTKQPEYETVWAHGGHCGIDDLDSIAMLGPHGR